MTETIFIHQLSLKRCAGFSMKIIIRRKNGERLLWTQNSISLFYSTENSSISSENISVSADFRFYDGIHNITAVFVANEEANVVRRIKTSYSIRDVVLEKDFSGTCKIGCPNRAAFTENIIEANKRIHLLTLKDKKTDLKVINLYMKRFPVYLSIENYDYILLKIENISVRLRDGILATLNSLYFPQLQSERFEMVYTVEGL